MPQHDLQRYFLPLINEHVALGPESSVLEQGYYDPSGALAAAVKAGHVLALRPTIDLATELDGLAREQRLATLETKLGDAVTAEERGTYDAALILAPFFLGNEPVRQAILTAALALKPAGTLYLQVHKSHGAKTFLRFAEEAFGRVELLGLGGGQRRLYGATEPKAIEALASVESKEEQLTGLSARGVTLKLKFVAGVFSAKRVDAGTQLLIQTVDLPSGARVLDLGCGAGAIGLAVAAGDKRAKVVLVDSSKAAVDLAGENAALNDVKNVEIRLSDGYEAVTGERFDTILSNLPAHRGMQADTEAAERFIAQAPLYLREGGELWVVANKALPYELPASRSFREVRVAANDGRYKVLHCKGAQKATMRRRSSL